MHRKTLTVEHEYVHTTRAGDEIRITETNQGAHIRINGGRLYSVEFLTRLLTDVPPEILEELPNPL